MGRSVSYLSYAIQKVFIQTPKFFGDEFLEDVFNDYDKIQFNKKSEYQDLTFKCVNFRGGMSKYQIDCDLYCIEKDAMVTHGTIEWIIGKFGDDYGMNIINRDEVENISNNRVEFLKSLKTKS